MPFGDAWQAVAIMDAACAYRSGCRCVRLGTAVGRSAIDLYAPSLPDAVPPHWKCPRADRRPVMPLACTRRRCSRSVRPRWRQGRDCAAAAGRDLYAPSPSALWSRPRQPPTDRQAMDLYASASQASAPPEMAQWIIRISRRQLLGPGRCDLGLRAGGWAKDRHSIYAGDTDSLMLLYDMNFDQPRGAAAGVVESVAADLSH